MSPRPQRLVITKPFEGTTTSVVTACVRKSISHGRTEDGEQSNGSRRQRRAELDLVRLVLPSDEEGSAEPDTEQNVEHWSTVDRTKGHAREAHARDGEVRDQVAQRVAHGED